MTIEAAGWSVPGGTRILRVLDSSRLLLDLGEELAVFDIARGGIVARRKVPGFQYADAKGSWIVVHEEKDRWLLRDDLEGDPIRWPDAEKLRLAGVVGSVAVFYDYSERMRFDIGRREVIDRGDESFAWHEVDEHAGLIFGVGNRTREIAALRPSDGAIVWKAKPFAKKVNDVGYPRVRGDEVHVRATALAEVLVARIGAKDGEVRGVRPAPLGLDSWLPDLGAAVDVEASRYERRWVTHATKDGIVIPQEDSVLVVRADGVSRVAIPAGSSISVAGNYAVTVIQDRDRIELVIMALPRSGAHDLVIDPKGEEAESNVGEPGVVTFAGTSAPIVIVQHPTYGRVTLTREVEGRPPPVGAKVVLDGVEITPGGTPRVERWWLAGERAKRARRTFELGPVRMAAAPVEDEPTQLVASLKERAEEEGIAVPDHVVRFLEVVDRDATFRRALGDLGFHFAEDELGLDILPELEIEGFVSVWGNGYGDGYGGLTKDGLGMLWWKDDRTPQPLDSLAGYVRTQAAHTDGADATVDLVLQVLDREGLR